MEQRDIKNLTDKAFLRLILTSIISILACIICLCSTTWAWFSESSLSNNNALKSANTCLATITLVDDNGQELVDLERGVKLSKDVVYTLTLSLPKDSASGYCVIKTQQSSYNTEYILHHNQDSPVTLTFTVVVLNTQTVKFSVRWGVYSGQIDLANGGQLIVQ